MPFVGTLTVLPPPQLLKELVGCAQFPGYPANQSFQVSGFVPVAYYRVLTVMKDPYQVLEQGTRPGNTQQARTPIRQKVQEVLGLDERKSPLL